MALRAPLCASRNCCAALKQNLDAKSAAAHGDIEILEIAYDSRQVCSWSIICRHPRRKNPAAIEFVSDAITLAGGCDRERADHPRDASCRISDGFAGGRCTRRPLAPTAAELFRTSRGCPQIDWSHGNERQDDDILTYSIRFFALRAVKSACSARLAIGWFARRALRSTPLRNRSTCKIFSLTWFAPEARTRCSKPVPTPWRWDRLWGCPFAGMPFLRISHFATISTFTRLSINTSPQNAGYLKERERQPQPAGVINQR